MIKLIYSILACCLTTLLNPEVTSQTASPVRVHRDASESNIRLGHIGRDLILQDPRLSSTTVKGIIPRAYVGPLLDDWHDQTGVVMEAKDIKSDDSGRWRVMVALREPISLSEAMNALRSTLSQKGATWQWVRSGKEPNYSYRLIRPASLESRNIELSKNVQDDFESAIERMRSALALPESELRKAASEDNTGVLNRLLEPNGVTRLGMTAFFSSLSTEGQKNILQGSNVEMPEAKFNGDTKAWVNAFAKAEKQGISVNGLPLAPESYDRVQFRTSRTSDGIIPYLSIWAGNDQGAGGWSYSLSRKHEAQWKERLATNILLREDFKMPGDLDLLTQMIIKPTKELLNPLPVPQRVMVRHRGLEAALLELSLAETPRVNFFARLPQTGEQDQVSVYGRRLSEVLEELRNRNVASKWQGNVLLFSYTAGFAYGNDDLSKVAPVVAYNYAVERLDAWAESGNVPLDDRLTLARLATVEQWDGLANELPEAFGFLSSRNGLGFSYGLYSALASARPDTVRELASERGVSVGKLSPELRTAFSVPTGIPGTYHLIYKEQPAQRNAQSGKESQAYFSFDYKKTIDSLEPGPQALPYWSQYVTAPRSWEQVVGLLNKR